MPDPPASASKNQSRLCPKSPGTLLVILAATVTIVTAQAATLTIATDDLFSQTIAQPASVTVLYDDFTTSTNINGRSPVIGPAGATWSGKNNRWRITGGALVSRATRRTVHVTIDTGISDTYRFDIDASNMNASAHTCAVVLTDTNMTAGIGVCLDAAAGQISIVDAANLTTVYSTAVWTPTAAGQLEVTVNQPDISATFDGSSVTYTLTTPQQTLIGANTFIGYIAVSDRNTQADTMTVFTP